MALEDILRDNRNVTKAIEREPDIMHGEAVFRGTRAPVQTLFDYLQGGDTLEDFLEGFPTVSRGLAIEEASPALCKSNQRSAISLTRIQGVADLMPLLPSANTALLTIERGTVVRVRLGVLIVPGRHSSRPLVVYSVIVSNGGLYAHPRRFPVRFSCGRGSSRKPAIRGIARRANS